MEDEEYFEFKPNISDLLMQESCSDNQGEREESDNDDDDNEEEEDIDHLDQSEDEVDNDEKGASTRKDPESDDEKSQKNGQTEENYFVKYEEDEVKMEPESESDEEDFETQNLHLRNSTSSLQLIDRLPDENNDHEKVPEEPCKKPKYVYKGENPPCEICGKMFSRPSDLIKHMVTHTGAREYKCDICQETFPLLNSLTR